MGSQDGMQIATTVSNCIIHRKSATFSPEWTGGKGAWLTNFGNEWRLCKSKRKCT